MEIKTLYKYTRPDGGTTVSPIKPGAEYIEIFRLIATEGMELTQDGENCCTCIDTDTAEGWREVEVGEATEEDYLAALETLGVDTSEKS